MFNVIILPASGYSIAYFSTQPAYLQDSDGMNTSVAVVGQQYQVNTLIHNNLDATQPFVILTEVRDGNGITANLFWQIGTLEAYTSYTVGTSWIPPDGCLESTTCPNFQIRTFVISSLENPMVLSTVTTTEVPVVGLSDYFRDAKLYQVSISSELHNIVYSLESGEIVKMQKPTATGPFEISLQGAESDGNLIIRLPAAVVHYAFYLDAAKILNGLRAYYPSVIVDNEHVDAEIIELLENESITFMIPLEAGTERITLHAASQLL